MFQRDLQEKEYLDGLKTALDEKKKNCAEIKDKTQVLIEVIKDPPYRCRDEEIVESYCTFVNESCHQYASSVKIWKEVIQEMDRETCVALTNYCIWFLKKCGESNFISLFYQFTSRTKEMSI